MPLLPRAVALACCLLAGVAEACRCHSPPVEVAYQNAVTVVRAKVLQLTPDRRRRGSRVKVAVSAAWKREVPATLEVATLDLCFYPLVREGDYLLFLVKDQGRFVTTRCMGNLPASEAEDSIRWLDRYGRSVGSRP